MSMALSAGISTFWEAAKQIVGALLALVLVCALAWVVLRWINRRMPSLGGGSTKRLITVLDRVAVGKNAVVLLLHVAGRVMLVAVSDHAIEKLAEYDAENGEFEVPDTPENPSFAAALKDAAAKAGFLKKDPAKGGEDGADGGGQDEE